MQRFFDTVDDPGVSDVVLTATAFNSRLGKLSLGIRTILQLPDILGVQEAENFGALQAIANRLNTDVVAAGGPNPNYTAHLVEGNDIGGIDVGFLVKSIGTVRGMPTPAANVVLASADLVNPDLADASDTLMPAQRYSFLFGGNAQELDHMLMTQNLLGRFVALRHGRMNADFPEVFRNDAARPERISDHDPAVAYFSFPKADLSITKTAAPLPVTGQPMTYTLGVANSQQDAAANVTVTDPLPPQVTFQSLTTPPGWSCTTPSGDSASN